jgi:deoxycytidine triphosphate deaminase
MKLGHHALIRAFTHGGWVAYRDGNQLAASEVTPSIGPNSIDVSLSHMFLKPVCESGYLDPYHPDLDWRQIIAEPNTPVCLNPGEFLLGSVRERFWSGAPIHVPDIGPMFFTQMYEGRSTCGRIGLASHITAGFGDYGFSGCFTLELVNHAPYAIFLWPGMRIGQIAFEAVVDPESYAGAYSHGHDNGPVPPDLGEHRFETYITDHT